MINSRKINEPRNQAGIFFINGDFKGKDIVSLDQFDRRSILRVFKEASKMKKAKTNKLLSVLKGKIAGLVFFEPSTRTFS